MAIAGAAAAFAFAFDGNFRQAKSASIVGPALADAIERGADRQRAPAAPAREELELDEVFDFADDAPSWDTTAIVGEDVSNVELEPLEERFPTLNDWIHPVVNIADKQPLRGTQRFGADRPGIRRAECGGGHCGNDLFEDRGTPIVAVAWGTVQRIYRNPDSLSGLYIELEHPEAVHTAYMHLESIAEDLQPGDEVQAGQVIGRLGTTGIKRSAPHLHFSLELPIAGRMRFVDPEPFLAHATVLEQAAD